jgi:hypothetical protein
MVQPELRQAVGVRGAELKHWGATTPEKVVASAAVLAAKAG